MHTTPKPTTDPSNARRVWAGSTLTLAMLLVGLVPSPTVAAAVASCSDSDYTGGIGGQTVGCPWECESPSLISVSVDATDNDAGVSGDADCGGGHSHCSGLGGCTGEPDRSSGGAGTCKGSSQERIDSGLHIECSSQPEDQGPPIDERICPVSIQPSPPYPTVCIDRPIGTAGLQCPANYGAGEDACVVVEVPGGPSDPLGCNDRAETLIDPCDPQVPTVPKDPLGCNDRAETLIDPCDPQVPTVPKDPLGCNDRAESQIDPCDPKVPPLPKDPLDCGERAESQINLCDPRVPKPEGPDCDEAQSSSIYGAPIDPFTAAAAQLDLCRVMETISSGLTASSSSAHIIAYQDVVFGLVCSGFACWEVVPECSTDEGTDAFECVIRND